MNKVEHIIIRNTNPKVMKAKCVKTDPLEFLEVGKTYELIELGQNHIVKGLGLALSKTKFEELFSPLNP